MKEVIKITKKILLIFLVFVTIFCAFSPNQICLASDDFNANDYINIVQNLSAVTAACFMVKKQLFIDMLGFDEKLAVAFNDVDFCLNVRTEKYLIV